MVKEQKMHMVICYYDPASVEPNAIVDTTSSVTEDALFAGLVSHLERGGLVGISPVEADLVQLVRGPNGRASAHEGVGLIFVPVRPVIMKVLREESDAQ